MIKEIFNLMKNEKDHSGRNVESVISSLSSKTKSDYHSWSYLKSEDVYENTLNGQRYYGYEIH